MVLGGIPKLSSLLGFVLLALILAIMLLFSYRYLFGSSNFTLKIINLTKCQIQSVSLVNNFYGISFSREHLNNPSSNQTSIHAVPAISDLEYVAKVTFSDCSSVSSDSQLVEVRSIYYLRIRPDRAEWHRRD